MDSEGPRGGFPYLRMFPRGPRWSPAGYHNTRNACMAARCDACGQPMDFEARREWWRFQDAQRKTSRRFGSFVPTDERESVIDKLIKDGAPTLEQLGPEVLESRFGMFLSYLAYRRSDLLLQDGELLAELEQAFLPYNGLTPRGAEAFAPVAEAIRRQLKEDEAKRDERRSRLTVIDGEGVD